MGINYFTNTYCSSFAFMKEGELMNIKDIATAYGVLVDKSLKVNEMNSTGNNSNANVPTIKLEVVDNSKLESVLYGDKE